MSKVTYLLGAGASYGERENNHGTNIIKRGVPIISEFASTIQYLISNLVNNAYAIGNSYNEIITGLQEDEFNELISNLRKIQEICEMYPTIDTFAKQVYITHSKTLTTQYQELDIDYIKRILTAFLIAIQSPKKRDQRYDGFIASVIKEGKVFPPMTILSWNYDAQFEFAYSGYIEVQSMQHIWNELNVLNKTYPTLFDVSKPFAMIKLNGTADFKNNTKYFQVSSNQLDFEYIDNYFGGLDWPMAKMLYHYMRFDNYKNILSYSWEDSHRMKVLDAVQKRVIDTKELIVIGYSFPYVNREMDVQIIHSMPKLNTIYVQDPNYDEIESRLRAIVENDNQFVDKDIKIKEINNRSQFYIPASFD